MEIKPIRSESDYSNSLKELELIFNSEINSKDGEKAEILSILIDDYENRNHPIDPPIDNWSFDYVWEVVKKAQERDNIGTLSEKCLKISEEVGELSAEILKLSGYKGTNETKEVVMGNILLESVDSMITIFVIMIELGYTKQQIVEMTEKQVNKWAKYVK